MLLDPNRQNATTPRPYHQLSTYLNNNAPAYYESALQQSTTPFAADRASIDLDFDAEHRVSSFASSPVSTQSVLSQYSGIQGSPLSTFDSIPTVVSPRGAGSLFDFAPQRGQPTLDESATSLFATDPMQTDSWLMNGHLTPRTAGRSAHQRESSLSSLGSNGPASPYSHNTSNPHIAVTDSVADSYHGLPGGDDFHYQLAKSYNPSVTHDTFYTSYPTYAAADHSAIASFPRIAAPLKRKSDRGLLPPDQLIGSRPVSVASSITSESPATPAEEPEDVRRRRNVINSVPKLDRTMSDIYNDELYNPNFTITSSNTAQVPISPSNGLFAQRVQAANHHLSAVSSPALTTSRDRSPFRNDSPLASMPANDFSGFGSAQQLREQNKAAQDARVQQRMRSVNTSTPQTISPKDAMLEFHDADDAANYPLFPQPNSNGFDMEAMTKAVSQGQQAFDSLAMNSSSFNNYLGPPLPSAMQIPQQYPFIAQRQQSSLPSLSNSLAPSRMGSAETGADASSQSNSPQRPTMTTADGGTYTCTYHGCTLRFDTPQLLQKHKREGHRQAHGLGGPRRSESISSGMTSTLLNSQAGPHRCDRINPSTGKPCNTIFSRPYDLTRHEDTIHNARKQKVRCDLCTDEKTFSRADALTRHYRVCHPDVEFHGKQRRRGGQSG